MAGAQHGMCELTWHGMAGEQHGNAMGAAWHCELAFRCWLVNQHWIWWWGLGNTQRHAWELISGPCLGAKAKFLSFNMAQSRAVTGLLTGHNILRRHLYLMGLSDSPLWMWSLGITQTCVSGLLFLEPEDIKSIRRGAIGNFSRVTGLKGPVS
jgi:hypothetical protein